MTTKDSWKLIDWYDTERQVFELQKRIFRKSRQDERNAIHQLQKLILRSYAARCLAVRRATEDSPGKDTCGVDGRKTLTETQKVRLIEELSLNMYPKPVRRVYIPKPGSKETRPLGIPTIADRAMQHLIILALEPEWEARFSCHQYGFRKGRSCHDALFHIKHYIRRTPRWVLDADIERFFDRLNHESILVQLDTFPEMKEAIRRILTAGIVEDGRVLPSREGTPQGGPLSPLLANVALSSLERDIESRFKPGTVVGTLPIKSAPRAILYADDICVLHEDHQVIQACKSFVDAWLRQKGLNLHPTKTRVVHTLENAGGHQAGFCFLGCKIQQFRLERYRESPGHPRSLWTQVKPSKKAVNEFLVECRETINKLAPRKKRNAAYASRMSKGQAGPIEVMIKALNRKIGGWCKYHQTHNAKSTFSLLDSELHGILWRWTVKSFPKRSRYRLVREFFNGGKPWCFGIEQGSNGLPVRLIKAASTTIERHCLIQADRSYFDGDFSYWGKRQSRYPGIPLKVCRLLRAQNAKCAVCKKRMQTGDRLAITKGLNPSLLHQDCAVKLDGDVGLENPFLSLAVRSSVLGDGHAGFEGKLFPRGSSAPAEYTLAGVQN